MNQMIAVRLPKYMVDDAKRFADSQLRSLPKQIEYWYRLGKACEQNPDLPVGFVKECLDGANEPSVPFDFGNGNAD